MLTSMKSNPYVTTHTKINSKWIKAWKKELKLTVRLLEENTNGRLHDIGFGSKFLEMTLAVQEIKNKKQVN